MSNYLRTQLFSIVLLLAFAVPFYSQVQEPVRIEIKGSELSLNGKVTKFPVKAEDIYKSFGKPDRTVEGIRIVSIWDKLGLIAFQIKAGGDFIEIDTVFDNKSVKFDFSPAIPFHGQFILDGVKIDQNSTRDLINSRRKVGSRFKPIIQMMSELTIGDLYMVLLQQDHKPYGAAKVWQLSVSQPVK